MLPFPAATAKEEKIAMIQEIKKRLLQAHPNSIMSIGAYGSIALGKDGPFSDIELHVITQDGTSIKSHEFILDKYKIEISAKQKGEFFKQALEVDDSWAIKAGVFIHIMPVYDPYHVFEEVKQLPLQVSETALRETMREFMIWEPYETIAKIRNNYSINNFNYIPLGAKDLAWQTAKLIGLANKQYYSTRARTYEESLEMGLKPSGYKELVKCVMEGELSDKSDLYELCENLWAGLNQWFDELGIQYKVQELPSFE